MSSIEVNHLPTRLLEVGIRLARWALIGATPLILVLVALVVAGVGTLSLPGTTETVRPLQLEPGEYETRTEDGRVADVAETTVFRSEDGEVFFGKTDVGIEVGDDATAVRAVAAVLILLWLALVWIGVSSVSAISGSMRAGEGFVNANARRLQRVGFVVLAYPVVTFVGRLILRRMVEALDLAGPAVSVDIGVADWWAWVLLGLLLLALAGLLSRGAELQELDEMTI